METVFLVTFPTRVAWDLAFSIGRKVEKTAQKSSPYINKNKLFWLLFNMENKEEFRYCYKYPHAALTADCVIFGFDGKNLNILLIERGIYPYKGCWAFPGGFMNMDETMEQCAMRELKEETGLADAFIKQFHVFSGVTRDPRERVVTCAFLALVNLQEVRGGDDAAQAKWFPLDQTPPLAFDHDHILRVALKHLKEKIHFEPIGFELLPEEFTMTQLQTLYEAILEVQFDRRNFAKKFLKLELIQPVEIDKKEGSNRHVIYYKFNKEKYDELKSKGFRLEF